MTLHQKLPPTIVQSYCNPLTPARSNILKPPLQFLSRAITYATLLSREKCRFELMETRPARTVDPTLSEEATAQMIGLSEEGNSESKRYDGLDESNREQREIQARRHGALSSSLDRTPPEIWEIIFSLVCSSTRNGYSLQISCRKQKIYDMPPVILSQVCTRWRQITLGCPELWASIDIYFGYLPGSCQSVLQLFLENSRGRRLSVRVQHESNRYTALSRAEQANWALLSQHLWRCSKLVLDMDDYKLLKLPSAARGMGFPNLLTFEGASWEGPRGLNAGRPGWRKALRNAPKLCNVITTSLYSSDIVPYSQIAMLKLRHLNPEQVADFYGIIPLCPQLKHLTLGVQVYRLETDISLHLDPVTMPSLETLTLESTHGADVRCPLYKEVFGSLRMPVLKSLRLQCPAHRIMEDGWPTALLDMLERTHSLQELSLLINDCKESAANMDIPRSVVSRLLRTIPNVSVLVLAVQGREHFRPGADNLLSALFLELAQIEDPLLPNLDSLRLYMSGVCLDKVAAEAVLQAAEARSPRILASSDPSGAPRLKPITQLSVARFEIPLSYGAVYAYTQGDRVAHSRLIEFGPGIQTRMRDLKEDGVKVTIKDMDGPPWVLRRRAARW
ncbi:hypothetical protein V5O48_003465 [Marasmius crinis-equi]|uniref:F-box domain-containing protein n=1 Tax=Marasmius crinis-equi TaxID=585013 RepID=A0ABR3FT10_9AGAR